MPGDKSLKRKFDFFLSLSTDIREKVYFELDTAKEYLNAWQTNKEEQRIIESALFRQRASKYYPAQFKILTALNKSPVILGINDVYLQRLSRKWLHSLKNPHVPFKDKLAGLLLVGSINKELLTLDSEQIKIKLNHANAKVCEAAWGCLIDLQPLIDTKIFHSFITLAKEKLHDNDRWIRRNAIHYLILVAALDKEVEKEVLNYFKEKLQSQKEQERIEASNLFAQYHPLLSPEIKDSIVEAFKNNLNHSDLNVRFTALGNLKKIAPTLDPKKLTELTDLVKSNLKTYPDEDHSGQCLAEVACFLEKETLADLVVLFEGKLDHSEFKTRRLAVIFFAAIAPLLEPKALAQLFDRFKKLTYLDPENWRILLSNIEKLTSSAKEESLPQIVEFIKSKMKDHDSYVREAALTALMTSAHLISPTLLKSCTDLIQENLNYLNSSVHETALNCLAKVLPFLEKEQQATFFDSVKSKLASPSLHRAVLGCLPILVLALEREIIILFVNSIKANLGLEHGLTPENARAITSVYLRAIAPAMSRHELVSFLDLIKERLNDKNQQINLRGVDYLRDIAVALDKDMLTDFVAFLKKKLNSGDNEACLIALDCLSIIAPKFDQEILPDLIDKLYSSEPGVHPKIVRCLSSTIPTLDKAVLPALAEAIINNYAKFGVGSDPTICLTAIMPLLEKKSLKNLVELIKKKLDSSQSSIHFVLLQCLTSLIPRLEIDQLKTLIDPLKKFLIAKDSRWFITGEALKCLMGIPAPLLTNFTDSLKPLLNSKTTGICERAMNLMMLIMTQLDSNPALSLDFSAANTKEAILINVVSDWVKQLYEGKETIDDDLSNPFNPT